MKLKNMTRKTDIGCIKERASMSYHAIYKTKDGLDYCRERLNAHTYESACERAQDLFDLTADKDARRVVVGFAIECW
jgi:hypothetical protein